MLVLMAKTKTLSKIKTQTKTAPKEKLPTPALFFKLEGTIRSSVLNEIKKKLKLSKNNKLYLIIKSTGGDAYTAVRIMRHIRTKYENVIGVVPEYAYSAASLMLLGTNNILVSPEGYIAPIDKPMEHPSTAINISALDVTQSLTNLSALVKQNAIMFYESMRDGSFSESVNRKDALRIAWKNSVEIIKPLVSQIDPVILQKCYRDLRIGLYYGLDLLNDYMHPDNFDLSWEIANKLVNVFPSHGYAIFREEMKKIGLKVENLEDSIDYVKLLEHYDKISKVEFVEDIYV